jgi:hypothetical protein
MSVATVSVFLCLFEIMKSVEEQKVVGKNEFVSNMLADLGHRNLRTRGRKMPSKLNAISETRAKFCILRHKWDSFFRCSKQKTYAWK